MRDLAALTIHLLVTIARLLGPGGARSVVAESLLIKHQLLILNRSRTRAPALHPADRFFAGLVSILMRPTRLMRSAIVLKPSTILRFHKALVKRKYRILFTSINRDKPGPRGPSAELISAIVNMKQRNPGFGYQRIANQISYTFNIHVDKDVVRRVLAWIIHEITKSFRVPFSCSNFCSVGNTVCIPLLRRIHYRKRAR